ncbi:MAG: VWA domain-containing protein [Afipia sp.]|nr:VWA domain-containing protein [Afipia sp.]
MRASTQIGGLTPELQGGDAMVDEANLPARTNPAEPAGSNGLSAPDTTSGDFTITSADGVKSLTVGGTAFITNGVFTAGSVTTPEGNTLEITAYDAATGKVSYTYTLVDNEIHPNGGGTNNLFDNIAIELTDQDGQSAPGTLSIKIVDDVPSAHADTNTVSEGSSVGGNVLTGLGADVFGADGKAPGGGVTGVKAGTNASVAVTTGVDTDIVTALGTLHLHADGTYTYTAKPNSVSAAGAVDHFVYTITDGDGDTSTTTLNITVTDVTLTGVNQIATVDEAALVTGSTPASTAETATGTLNVAGTGVTYTAIHQTTAHGVFDLQSNGNWTYTLTSPYDSGNVSGANTVPGDSFTYTAKDAFNNTTTGTVSINVKDDIPKASDQSKTVDENAAVNTNLLLILDTSGSMGSGSGSTYASGVTNATKLDVLKAAVNELFEQYGNEGNVTVRIVSFAGQGVDRGGGWLTLEAAKNIINGLSASGGTNYADAINDAMVAYGSSGKQAGADVQNVAYFISDGAPDSGSGVGTTLQNTWESFLRTNDITSYALGIGANVTTGPLDPVAYNGVTETQIPSQIVTDLSQLAQTLVGIATDVTGNLVTGGTPAGSFGADGGHIQSVTVAGETYAYDPTGAGSISGGTHGSFNTSTHVLTVSLADGGKFSVNMDSGAYTYTPPTVITSNFDVPVGFVLVDNDGDTAGKTLTIHVNNADRDPIVRDDHVITNVGSTTSGASIVIPDYALLFNDKDPDGQAITITGTSNVVDGTSATHAGVSVTFVDNNSNGGSFTYTGSTTSPNGSDTGVVTINRQSSLTLNGTGLDEILIGRDGANNTINGYEGNDVLISGDGNDVLTGGAGLDLMVGGGGNDTFNLANGDFVAGESIDGGTGNDSIVLTNATTVDFTVGTVTSVETLTGSAGNDVVTMTAQQFLAFTGGINLGNGTDTLIITGATGVVDLTGVNGVEKLQLTGSANTIVTMTAQQFTGYTGGIDLGGGTNTLNVVVSGAVTLSSLPTLTGVQTVNVIGSAGADTLTLTGAQLTSLISSGATIDLGNGADTLTISGNFAASNDDQIKGVENIMFSGTTLVLSSETEGFNITGSSGANTIIGSSGNDTINGGGGADIITGGAGDDRITYYNVSGSTLDAGTNTAAGDTLVITGSTVPVINLGVAPGADQTSGDNTTVKYFENVDASTATGSVNITGSSDANVISVGTGGGTIDAGAGADVVIINAGTSTTGWTVNLGASDGASDRIVFKHAGIGINDNTVATISNFEVANDKIAVLLNNVNITSGGFQVITSASTDVTVSPGGVIALVNSSTNTWVGSLTDDANNGAIEGYIQAATNTFNGGAGNYTFIVYSNNNTSTANAAIYSVNISDDTNPGSGGMQVEHIMTINSVGYGKLTAANFTTAADPIVLDLDHNGFSFTSQADGVHFDIDGSGTKSQIAWVNGHDGLLALDVNGNGLIDSGNELFTPDFAGGHYASGLAALASLDSNHDGVINSADRDFAKLVVWQDADHNGVSGAGELHSLTDLGITEISLDAKSGPTYIDGQLVSANGTFTYADGTKGSFAEVNFDVGEITNGDTSHVVAGTESAAGNHVFAINSTAEGLGRILDFGAGDVIEFSRTAFGNLAAGTLSASNFETNDTGASTKTAGTPEFIFNTTDHTLYYDADGAGGSAAIAMAKLENGHALTSNEIHLA